MTVESQIENIKVLGLKIEDEDYAKKLWERNYLLNCALTKYFSNRKNVIVYRG